MQKIIILAGAVILSGCSMGINQSVATINNRPYLVEKKTYTLPIPIYQWSGKARMTPLQIANEGKILAREIYTKELDKCPIVEGAIAYKSCLKKHLNENNN